MRAAIQEANASSCTPLNITFSVNGTITLGSNLPNITKSLSINGNGTSNTIISGNNLYRSLNSISTDGLSVTIQNLKATNGFVAGSGFGGAIDINSNGGTLTVDNVILTNGTAGYGGAINADDGTLDIRNSIFSLNTVNTSGGAIWLGSTVTSTLINCLITGNQGPAGGIHSNGGVLHIYNNTIAGNTNTSTTTVRNNAGTMTLINSIIANNIGGTGECTVTTGTTVQNSLIESGGCGITNGVNGNLTGDPALNPDYTLSSTSIAIGTGNNSLIPSGVTTDLAGNARIQQGTVDMGAYESTFAFAIIPEINLKGNSTSIVSGDATPSSTDHTDFGSQNVSSGTVVRTFTIENTGTGALNLTGSPNKVTIIGTNAADFTVTTQPTSPVAATNGTTTFQVNLRPIGFGNSNCNGEYCQ